MLNLYPNDGNFALPSFMVPQVPPDADPDEDPLVHVTFNALWLPYVLGALDQLVMYASWDADNDGKLLASMRAATLKEFIAVGSLEPVPAPYWDDDADSDDSLPADAQPWYGTVDDPELPPGELTFVENAAIWAFTGFIAVATIEVGSYPAVLFHTIAPKFVLAMRRGAFAEVVRIIIDGQDAATVDTSDMTEDEIVRVPLVGDPDSTTGHDIMIVQVA